MSATNGEVCFLPIGGNDHTYCTPVDKFPNPIAIYATRISTDLAKKTNEYVLSAFQKVGINPNVVIEQDRMITQLKAELATKDAPIERHNAEVARLDITEGWIGV